MCTTHSQDKCTDCVSRHNREVFLLKEENRRQSYQCPNLPQIAAYMFNFFMKQQNDDFIFFWGKSFGHLRPFPVCVVGSFPTHYQAILRYQRSVQELNSVLKQSTWEDSSRHQRWRPQSYKTAPPTSDASWKPKLSLVPLTNLGVSMTPFLYFRCQLQV